MSDFFSRLAERSLAAPPESIRPRLPGLFEPLPASAPSLPAIDSGPADDFDARASRIAAEHQGSDVPSTAPTLVAIPQRPQKDFEAQRPPAQVEAQTPVPFRQEPAAPPRLLAPRRLEPGVADEDRPPKSALRPGLTESAVSVPPSAARTLDAVTAPKNVADTLREPPSPQGLAIAPMTLTAPALPAELLARIAASVAGQRSQPKDERAPHRSAKQSVPASETVVEVSIGRIEIRGAESQSSSRKEAPRPAVMTLDEYLRQRRSASTGPGRS
ncbi:hypothetical protein LMG28688_05783 [Paraburkholderia caffeinitolerans]|uniref:Uncharacterized protein n=1 Tax=Paraburkholderia caffeinitolerans TaxID=1723730 RepID=A0A6J5GN53_9BURK|nr:hypothetical protein [Paraburkholderia caffeinitolerans]CAB3803412.1 hypothetical protein LMG28688_05783 [Paraburkholderia caffeinitolerans]